MKFISGIFFETNVAVKITFSWNQKIFEHFLNVDVAIYAIRLHQVTKANTDLNKALVVAVYTRLFAVNKNIKLLMKLV